MSQKKQVHWNHSYLKYALVSTVMIFSFFDLEKCNSFAITQGLLGRFRWMFLCMLWWRQQMLWISRISQMLPNRKRKLRDFTLKTFRLESLNKSKIFQGVCCKNNEMCCPEGMKCNEDGNGSPPCVLKWKIITQCFSQELLNRVTLLSVKIMGLWAPAYVSVTAVHYFLLYTLDRAQRENVLS